MQESHCSGKLQAYIDHCSSIAGQDAEHEAIRKQAEVVQDTIGTGSVGKQDHSMPGQAG
jgi:hypothetical protein